MKVFKKVLIAFTFILMIGVLSACSSINSISNNFRDAGFTSNSYNFRGGSVLFADVDRLVNDLPVVEEEEEEVTTEEENEFTTTSTGETVTTTTVNKLADQLGFNAYYFSNGKDIVAVVLEFESTRKMDEIISRSTFLSDYLDSVSEEYINGNCILLSIFFTPNPKDSLVTQEAKKAEAIQLVVDIFQGKDVDVEPTIFTDMPLIRTNFETAGYTVTNTNDIAGWNEDLFDGEEVDNVLNTYAVYDSSQVLVAAIVEFDSSGSLVDYLDEDFDDLVDFTFGNIYLIPLLEDTEENAEAIQALVDTFQAGITDEDEEDTGGLE